MPNLPSNPTNDAGISLRTQLVRHAITASMQITDIFDGCVLTFRRVIFLVKRVAQRSR
jgi:hypothetical protein